MFRVFVPGFGNIFVQGIDPQQAITGALRYLESKGLSGKLNPADLDNLQAIPFAKDAIPEGGLVIAENGVAVPGTGGTPPVQPTPATPPAGTQPAGQSPTGTALPQGGNTGGFNPPEGVSVNFGQNVLNEALRAIGIDTSRPGQGFFGSLFPEVQAAESIRSVLGLPSPQAGAQTADPYANFVQGAFQGGAQGFGQIALAALRQLAGGQGDNIYSDFTAPGSLGTNAANSVQNLASGALLSRLSPTAFSLFGNQLIGNVADRYGNQVARGNPPLNFANQFLQDLRL